MSRIIPGPISVRFYVQDVDKSNPEEMKQVETIAEAIEGITLGTLDNFGVDNSILSTTTGEPIWHKRLKTLEGVDLSMLEGVLVQSARSMMGTLRLRDAEEDDIDEPLFDAVEYFDL